MHASGEGQHWDWYMVLGQQDSTELGKMKSRRWRAPHKFSPSGKQDLNFIGRPLEKDLSKFKLTLRNSCRFVEMVLSVVDGHMFHKN